MLDDVKVIKAENGGVDQKHQSKRGDLIPI
jgi:hypothetical protein